MIDGQPNHSVIRRSHHGPERSSDVFAIVWIPRLAIHDSHTAENSGSLAVHRLHETRLPEFALGIRGERFFHLLLLGLPASQALFVEIDLIFGQREVFNVKFLFDNRYGVTKRATLLNRSQRNGQFIRPWLVLQVYPEQSDKPFRLIGPRVGKETNGTAEELSSIQ